MIYHTRFKDDFRWEGIDVRGYKTGDTGFRDVSKQILFEGNDELQSEIRYFEILPAGFSSLEKHRHGHAVVIVRGSGMALVGERIYTIRPFDLVRVPGMTWHQFRAGADEPLGFICTVNCRRDRPVKPTQLDLDQLRQSAQVADFIRT